MYRSWLIDAFKEVLMKDEKQYEWVDVTGEYTVAPWPGCSGGLCIAVNRKDNGCGPLLQRSGTTSDDNIRIRWHRSEPDANEFRIERRVEVEQPKEVLIHTTIIGGDDIVHQRRISYQSAKELGLIKWVPQVGDRVHEGSGAQGVIVYIAESGSDPIVVRLDKIDAYATFEYEASELTLIEAAPK